MKKFQWMRPRQHSNTHAFLRFELDESRSRIPRQITRPLTFRCGWFTIADLQNGERRAERCGVCVRAVRWDWLKEGFLDCLRTVRWWTWLRWSRP